MHPDAASQLLLEDGDKVRLGNEQGRVVLNASIFSGLQINVVVVESVWPNSAFEEGVG